jgi:arsenical-resistance protein 2
MESLVLRDGIKGWATAGSEYIELMLEYDAKAWADGC